MSKIAKGNTVYFSVKGQVVIPSELRRQFEIEAGTAALVFPTREGILLKPITKQTIRSLRGSLKGSKAMAILMEERKREREL